LIDDNECNTCLVTGGVGIDIDVGDRAASNDGRACPTPRAAADDDDDDDDDGTATRPGVCLPLLGLPLLLMLVLLIIDEGALVGEPRAPRLDVE
jgi:hypothetical protein